MPFPSALKQWATKLHDDVARRLACPEYCLDDEAVRHRAEMDINEGQRAIPIVGQLLQDNSDASTAAAALAAICEARLLDENGDKDSPRGLWEVVCSAIEHFAHDEASSCAKLADLMFELSKIDVRKPNGDVVKTPRGRFWQDLPLWPLYFGDQMTVHVGKEGAEGAYKLATWAALQILRPTLEVNPEDSFEGRRCTEHHVLAAIHWVFEAGAAVLQLCQDEYKRDGAKVLCWPALDDGVEGYSYQGDDGFHMERWGIWKAAFRLVAATEGIEPDVADKAAAAADEMDRLDSPMRRHA